MSSAPKMRILHVIDGIDVGGGEMVLVRLVEGLQAAGCHNDIVVLSSCGPLAGRLTAAGATVRPLGMVRGRTPAVAVGRLLRAVREGRPTIIQGWMYHGNLAASVARPIAAPRARLLWSIHNTLEPPPVLPRTARAALALTRAASRMPAGIIYVSEAAARQHERAGFSAARSRFIPNGTDCRRFRPVPGAGDRMRSALGVDAETLLVGMFARWHPMKGHAILLDAVAALAASGRLIHLLLAGTGVTASNGELAEALAARGLAARTTLLGERDDIEAIVPALDVFALPSIYGEAFPLVLGEAMAAGVLCVATDVGDARLIVGETGAIVPPGDASAFADALGRLLDSGAAARTRLGRLARERVEREFSLERMVAAYADLYDSVLLPGSEVAGYRNPLAGGGSRRGAGHEL